MLPLLAVVVCAVSSVEAFAPRASGIRAYRAPEIRRAPPRPYFDKDVVVTLPAASRMRQPTHVQPMMRPAARVARARPAAPVPAKYPTGTIFQMTKIRLPNGKTQVIRKVIRPPQPTPLNPLGLPMMPMTMTMPLMPMQLPAMTPSSLAQPFGLTPTNATMMPMLAMPTLPPLTMPPSFQRLLGITPAPQSVVMSPDEYEQSKSKARGVKTSSSSSSSSSAFSLSSQEKPSYEATMAEPKMDFEAPKHLRSVSERLPEGPDAADVIGPETNADWLVPF